MKDDQRKPQSIFRAGPFHEPNAYVGINQGKEAFGLYAAGFFDAGAQLARAMLKNRGKVDLTIYALVYLYRHGTELALKQLARSFGEIFHGDPGAELTALKRNENHSLGRLWEIVRPSVESAISLADSSEDFPGDVGLEEVDHIIGQLDNFDPAGVVFRYPESPKGDPHLKDVEYINIQTFYAALQRLVRAFETWRHHFGEEANYRWHSRVVQPWLTQNESDEGT